MTKNFKVPSNYSTSFGNEKLMWNEEELDLIPILRMIKFPLSTSTNGLS